MALPLPEEISKALDIASKLNKTINSELLEDRLKLTMWTKSNQGKLKELPDGNP